MSGAGLGMTDAASRHYAMPCFRGRFKIRALLDGAMETLEAIDL